MAPSPSPSPGGPSGRSQSWGPFQPQQPSWVQGVSGAAVGQSRGAAVGLGRPPPLLCPVGSHLLLDGVPALVGVPGWPLGRVPPDQLLYVSGHFGGQLGGGVV